MPNHTPTVLRRRAHWHCTKDTYGVTTFCRVRHRFMGTARQHNYGETAHLFLTGIATCYSDREGCDETRRAHEVEWTKAKTLAALRGGAPIAGGGPELGELVRAAADDAAMADRLEGEAPEDMRPDVECEICASSPEGERIGEAADGCSIYAAATASIMVHQVKASYYECGEVGVCVECREYLGAVIWPDEPCDCEPSSPPIAGGAPEPGESLSCPAGRDHVLNGRRFCATACDPTESCDHVRCAVLASEHRTAERIRARGPHALGYRRPS